MKKYLNSPWNKAIYAPPIGAIVGFATWYFAWTLPEEQRVHVATIAGWLLTVISVYWIPNNYDAFEPEQEQATILPYRPSEEETPDVAVSGAKKKK